MHPRNIAARNERARERITQAAGALADGLGLPPLGELTAQERRDRDVAHMRELEEVATLLSCVAKAILDRTEIYYDCPDCQITTVLAVGVDKCSGCGKPLELIQVS